MTDITAAEAWDQHCKKRWPWMPFWLRGLLFILGCEVK